MALIQQMGPIMSWSEFTFSFNICYKVKIYTYLTCSICFQSYQGALSVVLEPVWENMAS